MYANKFVENGTSQHMKREKSNLYSITRAKIWHVLPIFYRKNMWNCDMCNFFLVYHEMCHIRHDFVQYDSFQKGGVYNKFYTLLHVSECTCKPSCFDSLNLSTQTRVQLKLIQYQPVWKIARVESTLVLCQKGQYGHLSNEIYTSQGLHILSHIIWKFVQIATCQLGHMSYVIRARHCVSIWICVSSQFVHSSTCPYEHVSDRNLFCIARWNMHSCMMKFLQNYACQYGQVWDQNLYIPPCVYMRICQI